MAQGLAWPRRLMTFVLVAAFALIAVAGVRADGGEPAVDPHAGHMMAARQPPSSPRPRAAPDNPAIPPDNAAVGGALKNSPRHGEWVDIKMPVGPGDQELRRLSRAQGQGAGRPRHPRHRRHGRLGPRRRRSAREGRLHRHRPGPAVGEGAERRRHRGARPGRRDRRSAR